MALQEVLYHRDAPWTVGETQAARAERFRAGTRAASEDCYRDTYPNRVISIRPVEDVESGRLPSLRNMADKDRPVVVLDLDEEGRQGAASRTLKVEGHRLVPVTFDDRFGAVAVKLRVRHADPEQWESDERARIEKAESDNETETREYETAIEEYRALKETFPREVIDANRLDGEAPAFPEAPKLPRLVDVGVSSFDREANALARALPKTVTHTGTGLYAVKSSPTKNDDIIVIVIGQTVRVAIHPLAPTDAFKGGYITNTTRGQTRAIVSHDNAIATMEGDLSTWVGGDVIEVYDAWSTIQAANDQLFTDQGTAAFTASQYFRIYTGTYVENVVLSSFNPQSKFGFFIEAAPGLTHADVKIAPAAGVALYLGGRSNTTAHLVLRRIRCESTNTSAMTIGASSLGFGELDSCYFKGANGAVGRGPVYAHDCTFEVTSTNGVGLVAQIYQGPIAENCIFVGPSKTVGASYGMNVQSGFCEGAAIGCTFSNFVTAIRASGEGNGRGSSRFVQNTIYNCGTGVHFNGVFPSVVTYDFVNNIFKDCTTNVLVPSAHWPEETATQAGAQLLFSNNSFHGYTNFGYDGTDSKTYEEFVAFNNVDVSGDILTDPLLTSPATGDFSLQSASPCRNAGHGSGVVTGSNAVAFDKYHPDIGSWSSGTLTVSEPTLNSVTDSGDGGGVVASVTAANEIDTIYIYYKETADAVWTQWGTPRTGSGDVTLAGLTVDMLHALEARPFRFIWGESSAFKTVTPTSSSPLSASGAVSLPLENVRTLLANSGTFQTLVSAVDAAAAKASIHYPAKAAPWTRPRAVLNHTEPSPHHILIARGKGNGFSEEGEVEIKIEAPIGASYQAEGQEEQAFLEFGNVVGAIMTEMGALAGTTTYLDAQEFEMGEVVRSSYTKEDVEKFFYRGVITVRWGGG